VQSCTTLFLCKAQNFNSGEGLKTNKQTHKVFWGAHTYLPLVQKGLNKCGNKHCDANSYIQTSLDDDDDDNNNNNNIY